MPRYLTLFTPLAGADQGPPDAAHMQEMQRRIDEQIRLGKLIATGALRTREAHAFAVHRDESGAFHIDEQPRADWMKANGFAILQEDDKAQAIESVKAFLAQVGGGVSEVIELFEPPR